MRFRTASVIVFFGFIITFEIVLFLNNADHCDKSDSYLNMIYYELTLRYYLSVDIPFT
jgi:hypothetical protein